MELVSFINKKSQFKKNEQITRNLVNFNFVYFGYNILDSRRGCFYDMSRIMTKPDFCLCENKDTDQFRSNCEADQRLCFRYKDSTIPRYFLNPKVQASSLLLWMYSLVCVRPGRKP